MEYYTVTRKLITTVGGKGNGQPTLTIKTITYDTTQRPSNRRAGVRV